MDYRELRERLIYILRREIELEKVIADTTAEKESILKLLLPYIKSDVHSTDEFTLKKTFDVVTDIHDAELKDYLKDEGTRVNDSLVKKAIKAGMKFTNVVIIEKLTVKKKPNGLKEVSED